MQNINKLVWDNINCIKKQKVNINIFVDVNLDPLTYLVQEHLIAHITINILKHVIVIGALFFIFIVFCATPLLCVLLLLPQPSSLPFLSSKVSMTPSYWYFHHIGWNLFKQVSFPVSFFCDIGPPYRWWILGGCWTCISSYLHQCHDALLSWRKFFQSLWTLCTQLSNIQCITVLRGSPSTCTKWNVLVGYFVVRNARWTATDDTIRM